MAGLPNYPVGIGAPPQSPTTADRMIVQELRAIRHALQPQQASLFDRNRQFVALTSEIDVDAVGCQYNVPLHIGMEADLIARKFGLLWTPRDPHLREDRLVRDLRYLQGYGRIQVIDGVSSRILIDGRLGLLPWYWPPDARYVLPRHSQVQCMVSFEGVLPSRSDYHVTAILQGDKVFDCDALDLTRAR